MILVSNTSLSQMIDIIAHYLLYKESAVCEELGLTKQIVTSYATTSIYDSLSHYTSSIRVRRVLTFNCV